MDSTMQDVELNVADIFEHGWRAHPGSKIIHYRGDQGVVERSFDDFGVEVRRLAGALGAVGVQPGDVVATLCWNTPAHLAAYFAVPSVGAVLHTLNLRLHDDQLVFIINSAQDKVLIVDATLGDQLERIADRLETVTTVIVAGATDIDLPPPVTVHDYDSIVTAAEELTEWPTVPEKSAAALCFTSGTTGNPKGVVYSHRSIYLHTLQISTGSAFGFSDFDSVLPIVPMFHANAWGWPHAAWLAGSDIILNDRHLQVDHLARIIAELRPSAAAAVPTLWTGLADHADAHGTDLRSLRLAVSGGSPLSTALVDRLAGHGVTLSQGWGMTETSPLLTFSRPEPETPASQVADKLAMTGHLVPGVKARIVSDEGNELPCDGVAVGEIQLRGATIAGGYLGGAGVESFQDGWLRTGDLGVIHPGAWIQIKDRLKDGIKSGGEWISTVELEAAIVAHPDVVEVAVLGVPDAKWAERPLVCVVVRDGAQLSPDDLVTFLEGKVARWWMPERWSFLDEIPKTTVGKLDKRRLRQDYDAEEITVITHGSIRR